MKVKSLILASLAALTLNAAPEEQMNTRIFSLLKRANEKAPFENVIFSPYSMQQAIGMLNAGAKGKTAEQINQVFGFSAESGNWFIRNHQELSPDKQHVFSNYNAILFDRRLELNPVFIQQVGSIYRGKLLMTEFSKPAQVVQILNRIIEIKSRGMIKNALSENAVNPDMIMALVNVLHFKDKWLWEFQPKDTSKETFISADNKETKVDLMFQELACNYFRDDQKKVHGVILPYKDTRFEMIVMMPTEKEGKISDLLQALSEGALPGWLKSANDKNETILFLPKMKLSAALDLSELLRSAGMEDAFSISNADFSGIVNEEVCVDKVLHLVKLDVDESGTEAAAATVIMVEAKAASPKITNYFCADRPFCLVLRYKPTGAILFTGVINRLP